MAASTDSNMDFCASVAGILNEQPCPEHLQVLKKFTTALRDQENRDAVKEETFSSLLKVLSRLSEELQAVSAGDEDLQSASLQLQLTAECFRAQRNACVQNPRNQNLIRKLGFIDISIQLLAFLHTTNLKGRDGIFEPLHCGIQFLGNLAVGNQMCKDDIWKQSSSDLLLKLLSVDDEKTVNYTSMVLHTCLDGTKVEELCEQNLQLALKVMELCGTQPDLDWTVLIATQHFLKSSALVESMYSGMSHQGRVTLLELLFAQIREEDSDKCDIAPSVARFLATSFQTSCGAVLTLATGSASSEVVLQEALTVISLLDVLCEMTSDLKQFMFLQNHPDLLVTTVELLKQVHAIGKTSKNIFSAAQNFSSLSGEEDSSSQSPVVSFKAHLIRLIGNLCHGNTNNQNQVREMEGIPLILDNCNIDSNNPFISQWGIFAIRNLLEHNKENQQLVASLARRGTADYSALRELGFLVEERDGTLLLKTVRKDS